MSRFDRCRRAFDTLTCDSEVSTTVVHFDLGHAGALLRCASSIRRLLALDPKLHAAAARRDFGIACQFVDDASGFRRDPTIDDAVVKVDSDHAVIFGEDVADAVDAAGGVGRDRFVMRCPRRPVRRACKPA
ncbi:MAG: hypothetical protein GC162_19550 [Planctomycetes bacterium]|nr:hypothetical protein [Planctomycetota bacterium]